jgi:hypothetical protein
MSGQTEFAEYRIEKIRNKRRGVIGIGIVLVTVGIVAVLANFVICQTNSVKEVSDARSRLRDATTTMIDQITYDNDLLGQASDTEKDLVEYREVSEIIVKAQAIVDSAKKLQSESDNFGSSIGSGNIDGINQIVQQINDLLDRAKSFTEALEKKITTGEFDKLVTDLKTKITSANKLVNESKSVLTTNDTKSLSDEISTANELLGSDLDDDEKVKATSSMKSQFEDVMARLDSKMQDLQAKYDKKVKSNAAYSTTTPSTGTSTNGTTGTPSTGTTGTSTTSGH